MTPAVDHLLKRFNVIYYNNDDMQDIMVKTAPADPDFQINNVSELINRVNTSPPEGYFVITPGYLDLLSKNNPFQPLLAHRTKLSY